MLHACFLHPTRQWMAGASSVWEGAGKAGKSASAAAPILTLDISVPEPGALEQWNHLPS